MGVGHVLELELELELDVDATTPMVVTTLDASCCRRMLSAQGNIRTRSIPVPCRIRAAAALPVRPADYPRSSQTRTRPSRFRDLPSTPYNEVVQGVLTLERLNGRHK